MNGGKRGSGPPRRPRDPVARAVRSPAFRQRVVPDKRWQERFGRKMEPVTPEDNGREDDIPPDAEDGE